MPPGYKKLNASDGIPFSSTHQPPRYRKSTKFLTELLTKTLKHKKQDIYIEGIDIKTQLPVTIKVEMPSKEAIITALLQKAVKGDIVAIKEVWDRIEGKIPMDLGDLPPLNFNNSQVVLYLPKKEEDDEPGDDN